MLRKLLFFSLVGFILGCILGFLGAWIDHHNRSLFHGVQVDYWSDFLIIPSTPGNVIAWQISGAYDWGVDEDWDYRVSITLWNGIFWSVIFVGIGASRLWYLRSKK